MQVQETPIKDCLLLTPEVYRDARGFFCETFNKKQFEAKTGITTNFVQDNQSESHYGVVRGLHYQTGEAAQAKLIRVVHGKVLDVVVDLRRDSATFLKHIAIDINHESMRQLFVPRGCAHGFVTLSERSIFAYKCDNFYNKEAEHGIRYDDPELAIDWQIAAADLQLSEKDLGLPYLKDAIY